MFRSRLASLTMTATRVRFRDSSFATGFKYAYAYFLLEKQKWRTANLDTKTLNNIQAENESTKQKNLIHALLKLNLFYFFTLSQYFEKRRLWAGRAYLKP